MLYVGNYLTSALVCAATLTALGLPLTVAEGLLACAIVALASVAVLYAIGPARLAAWHNRRAHALAVRQSEISSIWGPMAILVWSAIVLAEVVHTFAAEAPS